MKPLHYEDKKMFKFDKDNNLEYYIIKCVCGYCCQAKTPRQLRLKYKEHLKRYKDD